MKNKTNNYVFEKIVKKLCALGMRQGGSQVRAYKYITSVLENFGIAYTTKTYRVALPVWKKCMLQADGKIIASLPTGFTSGTFNDLSAFASSLVSSRHFLDVPHINFNPRSKVISQANFSLAPSCAVAADSLPALFRARFLKGELKVEKRIQTTHQILVGNTRNPKTIVFSHFDSIGPGAIDNASGTALALQAIIDKPACLTETLFVFDGNEELSYDYPVYWGKGYRNFEKKYSRLMSQARKIIVVDCIGYAPTEVLNRDPIIKLAFPITNIEKYASKTFLITSNYDALMPVYHSDDDVPAKILRRFVEEAEGVLSQLMFSTMPKMVGQK